MWLFKKGGEGAPLTGPLTGHTSWPEAVLDAHSRDGTDTEKRLGHPLLSPQLSQQWR